MGCRELEPMSKWVKGEGEGCRPCKVALGIGQYRKALQDAGQGAIYEALSGALQSEDADTIGKVATAMDQVKAVAPPEVRAILESIDCQIQKKEECGLCQADGVQAPAVTVVVPPATPADLFKEDRPENPTPPVG